MYVCMYVCIQAYMWCVYVRVYNSSSSSSSSGGGAVVIVVVVVVHTFITGKPGPSSITLAPHFSDWDVIRVTRVGENGLNSSVWVFAVKIWDSVHNDWGSRAV